MLKDSLTELSKITKIFANMDTIFTHHFYFSVCGAGSATDNCAGMAHSPAWRCGQAGYKTDHGFAEIFCDKEGSILFGITPDFTDQDNSFGMFVILECI